MVINYIKIHNIEKPLIATDFNSINEVLKPLTGHYYKKPYKLILVGFLIYEEEG